MNNFNMKPPELVVEETNKIALIDADFMKYIVTYRVGKNYMFDFLSNTPEEYLLKETDTLLDEVLIGTKCKAKIFCFSGKTKYNFRTAIAREKPYKGARKSKEPMYPNIFLDMEFVYEYIREKENTLKFDDLEADDILCLLQDEDTFIYSKDKDMLQIPGTHYNIGTGEFNLVTEDDAWQFLMIQCLTGDSTDGILGLRGFGPAKVRKVFEEGDVDTRLEQILQLYMAQEGRRRGLDAFVENYSLLRLTLNRGEYLKEKYREAFQLVQTLKFIK